MTMMSGYAFADNEAGGDIPGKRLIPPDDPNAFGLVYEEQPAVEQIYNNTAVQNSVSASSLPSSVNLSTSNYFPPIRSQQGGSCAAWATTYYQFTYEAARLNNWDAKHNNSITSTDSNTILQAATGKITLDQSYVITNVPDECYYLNPVTF